MRYILILMFLSFASCSDNDEGFTIPIEEYLGNDLKIDGYYLYERDSESSECYIFYTNGIFFRLSQGGSTGNFTQVELVENSIANTEYMNIRRGVVDYWGLYNINSLTKEIIIQYRVQPFSGGLNLVERTGNILNDSTFTIKNETYSFKHFPKPDSLNSFVP